MAENPTDTAPPVAAKRPFVRSFHGDDFTDPYEWLRDADDPEVIAHLEAENTWTEQQTEHLSALREELFNDISARTQQTDLSVPVLLTCTADDGTRTTYWCYSRTVEGSEYPIHCRVPAPEGGAPPDTEDGVAGEQVLLDENELAAGHDFFSLGAFALSPDGSLLAYSTDVTGGERYTLRILDLTTGDLLPDTIEDTSYGVGWAGTKHLFYSRADAAWRPHQVLRHQLGTVASTDPVVVEEPDERFWLGVESSRDERWIVIGCGSNLTAEYSLIPADDPTVAPRVVAPRREGVDYGVEVAGDRLIIVHNDGAADFQIAEAPLDATSHEQWRTVLPAIEGVRYLSVDAYAGHVVVSLRRDGLTGLHVLGRTEDGNLAEGSDLSFDEPVYTVSSIPLPDHDTRRLRYVYGSLVTPMQVRERDLATGTDTVLKEIPILDHPEHGAYRSSDYIQTREWATAPDGTRVPISVVRHRDTPLDGSAPAVLYGYGSYEAPSDPRTSIPRLSLLDRGFVYAIAHIRGGGELGRHWYEQGKLLAKKNTFTDFVACAEHLIAADYTRPERLAAMGGSAGGLLVGAVANLAPQTFRAVLALVPFVDSLTTILKPELPLTVVEWEEWGNPLAEAEVYHYMKSYSPYENVTAAAHPAILATTSLNDTRVSYVEPAKWVAALRENTTAGRERPILLKTEMVAGHGGVSGRYRVWRDIAFEFAWLIDQLA
ncbi:MAG: S9 family peptidase [Propionibacteriaceae bacterium]